MARTSRIVSDPTLLQAALEGLELQRQRIDDQIKQVRELLKKNGATAKHAASPSIPGLDVPAHSRRQLSPEARKRIAAAQKRRWQEFRKAAASKKA